MHQIIFEQAAVYPKYINIEHPVVEMTAIE